MGREVKLMPMDFNWPMHQVWWGFLLPGVRCPSCEGTGKRPNGKAVDRWGGHSIYCDVCEGDGKCHPRVPIPEWKPDKPGESPPKGIGYQMWENTSEGSPISPVMATPGELARWLADNGASAFGSMTATYEQWLGMIEAKWAPSAVIEGGVMKSGVQAVGEKNP